MMRRAASFKNNSATVRRNLTAHQAAEPQSSDSADPVTHPLTGGTDDFLPPISLLLPEVSVFEITSKFDLTLSVGSTCPERALL